MLACVFAAATACTSANSIPEPATSTTPTSIDATASATTTSTGSHGSTSTASARSSNQGSATSSSVVLSQPPGSYTIPQYLLCGQQFMVFQGATLYTYPDIPSSFKYDPDTHNQTMVVALGADCTHGGTVSVAPEGAATVTSVAVAVDGLPLVVEVTPANGKTGTITFTPSIGAAIRTYLE